MATTGILTATDLARLSARGGRFELIRGELRELPPNDIEHAHVMTHAARYFGNFVFDAGLGELYAGGPGVIFEVDPDTVRAPDLAFVRTDRLPLPPTKSRFLGLIPDFILEIVSTNDNPRECDDMIAEFLTRDCLVALKVDPLPRTVTVSRKGQPAVVFNDTDDLMIDDLFPGFRLPVAKLFE